MVTMWRLYYNTWVLAAVAALVVLLAGSAAWMAVVEIARIPPGPTAYHDYSFAPFAAVAMGLPLAFLAAAYGVRWIARREKPPALVAVALGLAAALFVLALGSTR